MAKVVVTGGAGFIGSCLVGHLLQLGWEVVAFDNLSNGSLENLAPFLESKGFKAIKGDVTKKSDLSTALNGAHGVVHLAAIVSVQKSLEAPELVHDVNVGGTLNVLNASLAAGVKKFVFASSAAVYGDGSRPPFGEDSPLAPLSLYGATKLAGESYCGAYHGSFGLETLALRFANVYGRRKKLGPYGSVMVRFAEAIQDKEPFSIFGSGTQTRDFVHVSDVVKGVALALSTSTGANVLNIGSGTATQINKLADLFASHTPRHKWRRRHLEARRGEIEHSYLNIKKARRAIGYHPAMKLSNGVSDFARWYSGVGA